MFYSKTELNRDIRHAVDSIVESLDDIFDPETYADVMLDPSNSDLDDIIRNFRDNYRTPSLGYVEGDELDGDELADALIKSIGREELVRLIAQHSEYITSDYYVKWNEMDSVQIGEYEYEIDVADHPELAELIAQATDADWPSENRDSFLAYGHPCDRVIACLDAESFLQDATVQASIKRSKLQAV